MKLCHGSGAVPRARKLHANQTRDGNGAERPQKGAPLYLARVELAPTTSMREHRQGTSLPWHTGVSNQYLQ